MNQIVGSKEVWIARLRDFLHDCAGSAPSEEADRIREASVLFLQEPRMGGRLSAGARDDFDPALLEVMLDCGATESAALALVGGDVPFMLSRGMSGNCLATLVMADGSEEMICEAATLSLALLAAYVSMLLTGLERKDHEAAQHAAPAGVRLH